MKKPSLETEAINGTESGQMVNFFLSFSPLNLLLPTLNDVISYVSAEKVYHKLHKEMSPNKDTVTLDSKPTAEAEDRRNGCSC